MKKIVLIVSLLWTSAAFGQYIVNHIDNQPLVFHVPEHPQHAGYAPIAEERGVVGGGGVTFAQGERPVSDFPQMAVLPLGDAARELKKQHAQLKKARFVWEN